MPIYEYQCPDCLKKFEKIQSFSSEPIKDCIFCGNSNSYRLISVPSLIFRSRGFKSVERPDNTLPPASSLQERMKQVEERNLSEG